MWQQQIATVARRVPIGVLMVVSMNGVLDGNTAPNHYHHHLAEAFSSTSTVKAFYESFYHSSGIHRSTSCEQNKGLFASASTNEVEQDTTTPAASVVATSATTKRKKEIPAPVYWDYSSYEPVRIPERGTLKEHAIFGTLSGDTLIEKYEILRPVDDESKDGSLVVVAHVGFGSHLNGHNGVVHGGILSLMFDDIMGCACGEVMAKKAKTNPELYQQMPVTANLNIDFRKPVLAGTRVRIEVQLEQWEGRKLFWKARMFGDDENNDESSDENKTLYAEATCLYILIHNK